MKPFSSCKLHFLANYYTCSFLSIHVLFLRLGQDPPLGNEHHVLAAELLLELSHKPGLDLLKGLELGHRHEDNNSLLSSGAVNLLSGGDVKLPEGSLQVAVDLKVQEGLADLLLDLIGLLIIRLDNFTTGECHTSLVEVNQAIS